jgi:hypothetical protein
LHDVLGAFAEASQEIATDAAEAAHGVQFAGNPGWHTGSSGTQYHYDPDGHYDGRWANP